MRKFMIAGPLVFAAVGAIGCVGPDEEPIDQIVSPLIGVGGVDVHGYPGVRGFTAETGEHTAVFREDSSANLSEARGTPFGAAFGIAGAVADRASPWGYRRHDGREAILYVDILHHVHEVTILAGNVDLFTTFSLNAPNVATATFGRPTPDVIGYVRSDNQSAIVYRSDNNHVIELRSNFGGQPQWLVTDLTATSGALVTASQGSPFPYLRSDFVNTVVYAASDDHIHELSSLGNGAWSDGDLFVAAGDTTMRPVTEPWGYKRSDGVNSVVFVDGTSKVRELALSGGHWTPFTLPSALAMTGSFARPSGYVRPGAINAVVYQGRDQAVHELSLSGGVWTDAVLATPGVVVRNQLFGHAAPGARSSILFSGTVSGGYHRYELSLPFGGQWGLQQF